MFFLLWMICVILGFCCFYWMKVIILLNVFINMRLSFFRIRYVVVVRLIVILFSVFGVVVDRK